MADVTLRESLDVMRSFLRAGHLAEAFALGRHILSFYPKHIETYTVLAQVSLATNDIAGANDLLRRVLSSDPENVIALAGMALISEAQDKQDEALWYLERAYEIQPSNDELRGELLRVREQYYGTAPARVELTAGALARVYARQGQYAQAVSEYRRLLRSETQRYDAQVGLAETLYRAGRTDEAAQVAQAVMADAPYSLKPNLILGALWSENAVPEAQQFLQRAHQLDPEHRVARDLLGDRFDGTEPPRLPEMGETLVTPAVLPPTVQPNPADAYPIERDTARAALLLSEIERAQELEASAQEPLVADSQTLERVEWERTESESSTLGTVAKVAAGVFALDLAADALEPAEESFADAAPELSPAQTSVTVAAVTFSSDPTLEEIAAAERTNAEEENSITPAPVEKVGRGKSEGVSTEVLAAAAAALATSIALDKSNQPAPTRRTHSAIPKVRPVIPGNTEKLPSWLYLSATPANANASFDALPDSTAEGGAPASTQPDRPDWLVQAQAASESEPVRVNVDEGLPDWLKPAAVVGASAVVISELDKPTESPFAATTDESKIESGEDTLPLEQPPVPEPIVSGAKVQTAESEFNPAVPLAAVTTADIIADRSDDETPMPVVAAPGAEQVPEAESSSVADSPSVQAESLEQDTIAPAAVAAAVVIAEPLADELPALEPVAAVPVTEERPQTQAQPDSATMLQMARDKRDRGDLKGALDLYERVMHRRPNHLDQVTLDLEAIVNAGGAPLSANRLLGEAYAMAGRFKESLVQYRTAMGKKPTGS